MEFTIQNNINGEWEPMAQTIGFGMAMDCLRKVFNAYGGEYRIVNKNGVAVYPFNQNQKAE
jgi:hypothetical protein